MVAQITAGILSLLVAAVLAYLVFVNDRRTTYDDAVLQHRFEIRQELLNLRRTGFTGTAPMLLPPNFVGQYAATEPTKKGADVINEMLAALIFRHAPMERLLVESAPKAWPQGPMRGRAFMVAVNETVSLITRSPGGLVLAAPEAFPSVPVLGYPEWQRDYEQLREAYSLIRFGRPEFQADFEAALVTMPEWQRRAIRENANTSLNALDRAVTVIDGKLDAITRAELIGARYHAFEGAESILRPALVLVSIAVAGGVLLPFLVPLFPRLNNKAWALVSIAAGMVPSMMLVVGFVWYAWQLPQIPVDAYAPKRWLGPLHSELETHSADLFYLREVNQNRVLWAKQAIESGQVSPAIQTAMAEYSRAVDAYNQRRDTVVSAISRLMSDKDLSRRLNGLSRPLTSGTSSGLGPIGLLDSSLVTATVSYVAENPSVTLSIEGPAALNIPGSIVQAMRRLC